MAVQERRILRFARGNVCLGKKTGSQAIYGFFLFSLLIHALFLLYTGPPISQRCLESKIRVDFVPLKAPSPPPKTPMKDAPQPKPKDAPQPKSKDTLQPKPKDTPQPKPKDIPQLQPEDIPRPYVRSKGIPQESPQFSQIQEVRIPTEYQSLKPVSSPPQAVPLEKPLAEQETTDKTDQADQADLLDKADEADQTDKSQERAAEGILMPSSDSTSGPHAANVSSQVADAAGQVKGISLSHNLPMKRKAGSDRFDSAPAYQGYQEAIREHIEHHKSFPSQARQKGWEGSVSVRFLLHRDGRVEQIKVTRSSAIALLDEAAIRAVREGNPFPPFPEGIRELSLWFEVPLVFELQEGSGSRR